VNYLLYSNGMLSYLQYLLCCFVVILTCCLVLLIRSEMAGRNTRNDDVIAATLSAVAQALAQNQGNGGHGQEDQGEVEERRLDRFMRKKPLTFKGRFNPEGALTWMESMERIFRAMVTNDDQKVRLATHMLAEEAEYWWTSTKRRIEASGDVITWVRFKNEFLKKYFSEDLRNKKEAEFLNLKQGSMSVVEYAAKYEELSRFCPYINAEDAMVSKCVKFENGLRSEIYQYICFHEIRDFDTLVHKCRMFDDARKAKMNYYKAVSDKKGKGHGNGKPYNKDKGKRKDDGGGSKVNVAEVKCFKCGVFGHFASDCKKGDSCFKCGQKGHEAFECKRDITCYNCGEAGHLSTKCTKPKKAAGKVFALIAEEVEQPDNLI